MPLWNCTGEFQRDDKADSQSTGKTCRNDQGYGSNDEHSSFWDVYIACESAGSGSYGRGAWSADSAAVYADGRGNLDAG